MSPGDSAARKPVEDDRSLLGAGAPSSLDGSANSVRGKQEDSLPAKRILTLRDYRNLLLLSFWVFGLNGLGLGALEFFRHTEADRTLIGWEMAESGNYLVPHLLHSTILTKPPMYYWTVAASITFWESANEWVARFPSLCASVILVLMHYLLLRRVRCSEMWSLCSALFLSTSITFLVKGTAAEIDMLFTLFCTISLYAAYFATVGSSLWWTLTAYFVAALAFLTKGPPIVFFFAAAHLLFFIWHLLVVAREEPRIRRASVVRFLGVNALGVLVFLLIVLAWLIPLAHTVGWVSLGEQIRVEVLERVTEGSGHERGPLFYVWSLLTALSPWSLFLVVFVGLALWNTGRSGFRRMLPFSSDNMFLVFNLIVVASAVVMLSLAAGKSSRYIFPIQAFAINLTVFSAFALRRTLIEKWLLWAGAAAGLCGVLGCGLSLFIVKAEGVPFSNLVSAALVLGSSLLFLGLACWRKRSTVALGAVILVMFAIRFGQFQVYIPHRNATRSVQQLAQNVNQLVPPDIPVYTVEMFERWVNYYLKRMGRDSRRLTPAAAQSPTSIQGRVFVLLNAEEEYWRVVQLGLYDETMRIVGLFEGGRENFILLHADAHSLPFLSPKWGFPTMPSKPFYSELPVLSVWGPWVW